jgi:3-methylcrotonyl-CoA carboxylase alpha subunit
MFRISQKRSIRRVLQGTTGISRSTGSSTVSMTPSDRPFEKVLIANRGEIACRVIRTCQTLKIPTVALYSVADGPHALHAQMADEAYLIGTGPHPTQSYLLQDEILEIAKATSARAIHPGYGFLSENHEFSNKVSAASTASGQSMVFVGPPQDAILAMGSKSRAKAIMEAAGVPTTPGYYGDETQDASFLQCRAKEIGYPLLIKAVMGGGGKGMRIVWKEADFLTALQACQRESLNSFGDDRVLLEKYLHNPRHVEVQVMADSHGNVVHLFERDCSLQRRHQKIIEEAPASDLPMELRQLFGEMGKRAAQAVGYVNAGTVEFLLEGDQFYFCEMNTRLQVEHPITELVTGIDLVEWQLRIAAGEPLPMDQSQITTNGHAIEARIYAENPHRQFLPAIGKVWHHVPPAVSNTGINQSGVRVDTGIQAGQEVGVYYDPMICKLIVHDVNRDKALRKLVEALKSYQIAGVPTNIDFLVACAQHETFQKAGAINTGFLDDHLDEVLDVSSSRDKSSPVATAIGVFAVLLRMEGRIGIAHDQLHQARQRQSPWSTLSGSWRMGGNAKRTLTLEDGRRIECTCHRDGSYDISVDSGESFHLQGSFEAFGGAMQVVVNGSKRIPMTTAFHESEDGLYQIRMWPTSNELLVDDYFWQVNVRNPTIPSSFNTAAAVAGHGSVKAPMSGKVSRVLVSPGDAVTEGDVMVVMEAMKMEHSIIAPASGIVESLHCKVGEVVPDGVILAVVVDVDSGDAFPTSGAE